MEADEARDYLLLRLAEHHPSSFLVHAMDARFNEAVQKLKLEQARRETVERNLAQGLDEHGVNMNDLES